MTESEYTHCGHGRLYSDACEDCERIWAESVTLPSVIRAIRKLRRFYSEAELRGMFFPDPPQVDSTR